MIFLKNKDLYTIYSIHLMKGCILLSNNYQIKKTIFVIIVIFLLSINLFSNLNNSKAIVVQCEKNPIDFNSAHYVAQRKLLQFDKKDYDIISTEKVFNNEGRILFYVFHLMPNGYIVVTADRNLPPIIAYSFFSSFKDKKSEKSELKELLIADIELRLKNIPSLPDSLIQKREDSWNKLL